MRFKTSGFRAGSVALLLACSCAGPAGTGAPPLTAKSSTEPVVTTAPDQRKLAAGGVVTRPLDFERNNQRYVGGVSRGLVPASPEKVLAAVLDADSLRAMLPRTKRVSRVDGQGESQRIELLQGNRWVSATYTVELSRTQKPGEVRFRLDRSRHHDIDDVYGYFKVERFDDHRSLVTVAAAVDIGSGLTTMLFGKKVQDIILSTPNAMRAYFARAESSGMRALVAQNDR
jgi:hypothetical protein